MGTQEERDWVDVAKDLLSKCHINLRLTKVTDCDASVFVALYEAILGERVPDYIAAPQCQEDDVHNVQSVIDSLALDYLQISLSHITGENIVRGDAESNKNLLEIFDGLLEYLTEQISEEEFQDEGEEEAEGAARQGGPLVAGLVEERPWELGGEIVLERMSQSSSAPSTVRSGKRSLPSWSGEGSGSTAELIRLGDSARTFLDNHEGERSGSHQTLGTEQTNGIHPPSSSRSRPRAGSSQLREPTEAGVVPGPTASLLREPLRSAIPLQPPYQTTPQRPEVRPHSSTLYPEVSASGHGGEEEEAGSVIIGTSCGSPDPPPIAANGLQSPRRFPDQGDRLGPCQREAASETAGEQEEPPSAGAKRVLFRTQPDVHLLTAEGTNSLGGEDVSPSSRQRRPKVSRDITGISDVSDRAAEELAKPLSWHRQRNRQTEQELHLMSEKLSRRLEELDSMLKRALGEVAQTSDGKEEDKNSHHSDSVMECGRSQRLTGVTSPCTRSLSPSPPPVRRSLLAGDSRHQMWWTRRRELQGLQAARAHGELVGQAYEEELKRFEERERAEVEEARRGTQETESEYREAVRKDTPHPPKSSRVYTSKASPLYRSGRARHLLSGRGRAHPRKSAPLKVKENDLLPTLLEEFPRLQLSPHTLTHMWRQQLKQVDRLGAPRDQRSRNKLVNQVEEAQRRHDLLVEIIRKEQEHNRRLRDSKERTQQQRASQNRLREQRQQVARARKYHEDYHVQMRARMTRARTREERMFRQVFEEGLELQKARLREQRSYAKEQRQENHRRHQDELESMENYYRDQFSLLAETLAQERREIQVRKKAQEKALQKMKRDLRLKMEREIGELQKIIVQNDDDDYFRDLEVERLRGRVQMASFQYSTSHLP